MTETITTTTTETMKVQGFNFKVTTIEQTMTAFCDCCPNQASGTKTELINRGWTFSSGAEFCGECI